MLVALSNDTCGDLFKRIASYRGAINVVVGEDSGAFDVIVFHRSPERSEHPVPACEDRCEVGETSELGLLVTFLRKTRKMTQLNVIEPSYEAELVDRDEEAFAGI